MGKIKDFTGKRIGRLTILGRHGSTKQGLATWDSKCECGETKVIVGRDLTRGHTKSCRCYHRDRISLPSGIARLNVLYARYKKDSLKTGRTFEISLEKFKEISESPCYYCGVKPQDSMILRNKKMVTRYNGMDRYDNSRGYEINNVVSCCWNCNRAKGTMNGKDFVDLIIRIAKLHS